MSKLKLFLKGISGVRTMCAMFFAKQGQDDSSVHEVLGEVRSGADDAVSSKQKWQRELAWSILANTCRKY